MEVELFWNLVCNWQILKKVHLLFVWQVLCVQILKSLWHHCVYISHKVLYGLAGSKLFSGLLRNWDLLALCGQHVIKKLAATVSLRSRSRSFALPHTCCERRKRSLLVRTLYHFIQLDPSFCSSCSNQSLMCMSQS